MYDHMSSGRHGVRGQEPDDGRVLAGVRDLHGTGHDDIAPAEHLVADVLQAFSRVHLNFDIFVDLRDDKKKKKKSVNTVSQVFRAESAVASCRK